MQLCVATQLSAAAFLDMVVYCSGCAELWVGGECGILPDGLVAPPAPWPGSVSGPHWLAAAPRTPSLLSQACPGVVLSPPPIWHIAGLSPRACERRVGGISERGEGYELTRGEWKRLGLWRGRCPLLVSASFSQSAVHHRQQSMSCLVT